MERASPNIRARRGTVPMVGPAPWALARNSGEEQEVRDLIAMAAHDFRSPIAAISLHAAALMRRLRGGEALSASEVSQVLDTIVRIGQEARELIDDVLAVRDADDIDRGQRETVVDVEEVVQRSLMLEKQSLDRAGCRVRVVRRRGFHGARGWWNRGLLQRILVNLFRNVAEHAPRSLVRLSLGRRGDALRLVFSDSGATASRPGQIDASRASRHATRHGLGLRIVRSSIEGLGGRMAVETSPNRGLVFVIDLPVRRSPRRELTGH